MIKYKTCPQEYTLCLPQYRAFFFLYKSLIVQQLHIEHIVLLYFLPRLRDLCQTKALDQTMQVVFVSFIFIPAGAVHLIKNCFDLTALLPPSQSWKSGLLCVASVYPVPETL